MRQSEDEAVGSFITIRLRDYSLQIRDAISHLVWRMPAYDRPRGPIQCREEASWQLLFYEGKRVSH
jgi:hypothetical protein